MGMFDSIYFRCQDCGEKIEAQSKSGDCALNKYDHSSVPKSVAEDANRHAPFGCKCGAAYEFYGIEEESVYLKVRRLTP